MLELLHKLKVDVLTGERVTEVSAQGVKTATGREIPAELVVWAAGIKAPDFLKDLDGLETNRINQLVVTQDAADHARSEHLRVRRLRGLSVAREETAGSRRARSRRISRLRTSTRCCRGTCAGKPLEPFVYRDFGSLVSLGKFSTVGSLMGSIMRGSLMIEGYFAMLMYLSLYKMHEFALHGFTKVSLDTLARILTRRTEPHVKLH